MFYIPENKQYLNNLNEDKMDIYRWSNSAVDTITGITRPGLSLLQSDVKCGLSFKNLYNETKNDPGYDLNSLPIIFCDPSTDIKASDILEVTNRAGAQYKLKCGEPNQYGGSHIQVTCTRYEDG